MTSLRIFNLQVVADRNEPAGCNGRAWLEAGGWGLAGSRRQVWENGLMPFSRVGESRIKAAVERGEFENLPGAGKPLNLEEYFSAPADMRMAFSILKNANCVPPEVELLNEVSRLQRAIAGAVDPAETQELQRALANRQTQLGVVFERRR
jgi:hypothetical protein